VTRRLLVLAAIVALGAAVWFSGLLELVRDPERARALLDEAGPLGPVLFVLAFGLLEPFGVPGVLFVVPAVLAWPLGMAFALSWAGSILAGMVGFGFARTIGRDWVMGHMPERLHAYDQRLAERGLRTVILVRLIFFLAPPAHWALGLSRVRFAPFVLGTAIGFVPGIAALTLLGRGAFALLGDAPRGIFLAIAIAVVAIVVLVRWLRGSASPSARPE
jgi:uncharacterized membrane protein YdjX (TVP38/TMEM64 family)